MKRLAGINLWLMRSYHLPAQLEQGLIRRLGLYSRIKMHISLNDIASRGLFRQHIL
jgi:hypothetical protein